MWLATSFTIFVSLLQVAAVKGQSATGDGDDPALPAASDDPSSNRNVVPIVVPIVVAVVVVIGLVTCCGLVMFRRSRRNGNNNLKLLFFGKTPTLALETESESHGSSSDEDDGQAGDLETGAVDSTTQKARKASSKKSKKQNGSQKDIILGEGSLPIDSKELAAVVSNFFHGLPDENGSNNNNTSQQQPKKTRQPSLGTTAIRILEAASGAADHDIDIEIAAAQEAEEEAYSVYSGSTLSIFGDSTLASGDTRERPRGDPNASAPPEVRVTAKADENDGWTAFRQEAGWPSGSSVEKVKGKKRHVRCSLHL